MSLFDANRDRHFFNLLGDLSGKRVLDLGCGTGRLDLAILSKGATVHGIDIQTVVKPEVLDHPRYTFQQADATTLDFKETFDVVISYDVIEHVEDDRGFVVKAIQALKPGGLLLLGTPNRWRTINTLKRIAGRAPQYPLDLGDDSELGSTIHLREYTFQGYRELVAPLLSNVRIFGYWVGLGPGIGIPVLSQNFQFLPYHYLFCFAQKT